MLLVLPRKDLERVLDMETAIEAVELAFAEYGRGRTQTPLRTVLNITERDGDVFIMPAYVSGIQALATKVVTVFHRNPSERNLPTTIGSVLLNNPDTGAPLALLDGSWLTAARTGAVSGVAARYMARPNSHIAALIGCGGQGQTQAMSICRVLPIQELLVYDAKEDCAERFVEEMQPRLDVKIRVVQSAEEAVRPADAVLCATNSKEPVVLGRWIRPGAFVSSVGSYLHTMRELDTDAIVNSRLVVDSRPTALAEAGDVVIPLHEGRITADHMYAELSDLVLGLKPGRENDQEITVFKSVGMAIQDAAVARKAYERALASGAGLQIEF